MYIYTQVSCLFCHRTKQELILFWLPLDKEQNHEYFSRRISSVRTMMLDKVENPKRWSADHSGNGAYPVEIRHPVVPCSVEKINTDMQFPQSKPGLGLIVLRFGNGPGTSRARCFWTRRHIRTRGKRWNGEPARWLPRYQKTFVNWRTGCRP